MSEIQTIVRLLVVDDHAMFRDAIAEKLGKEPDMSVVGACGSAAEALDLLQQGAQPAVILLDFDLGGERVIDFLMELKEKRFEGQVLVVTAGVSGREAVQLIQTGVRGILHKHNTPKALCDTIRQIARGEAYVEQVYLDPIFHGLDQTPTVKGPHLTDRDKAVLRLLFQGLANKEIAAHLQISEGAVKSSISQLFQKLGVRTRAQVVKVALEQYGDDL
jgi:two-component system, NarL family, nitrate/nitrite response regulator NarL